MVTGKKFIPVETNSESISSNIINGLKKLGVV
jgi:hypothetical protein